MSIDKFKANFSLKLKQKGPSVSSNQVNDNLSEVRVSTFLAMIKSKLLRTGEAYFNVKVRPNANVSQIKEITADEVVRLDLKAKPVQGQANKELIRFLAKELAISKESIRILAGKSGRDKLVKIVR